MKRDEDLPQVTGNSILELAERHTIDLGSGALENVARTICLVAGISEIPLAFSILVKAFQKEPASPHIADSVKDTYELYSCSHPSIVADVLSLLNSIEAAEETCALSVIVVADVFERSGEIWRATRTCLKRLLQDSQNSNLQERALRLCKQIADESGDEWKLLLSELDDHPAIRQRLDALQAVSGELNELIPFWRGVVEKKNDDIVAWEQLAIAYERNGNIGKAKNCWQNRIRHELLDGLVEERRQLDSLARRQLRDIYATEHDFPEEIGFWKELVERFPEDIGLSWYLQDAYTRAGENSKAGEIVATLLDIRQNRQSVSGDIPLLDSPSKPALPTLSTDEGEDGFAIRLWKRNVELSFITRQNDKLEEIDKPEEISCETFVHWYTMANQISFNIATPFEPCQQEYSDMNLAAARHLALAFLEGQKYGDAVEFWFNLIVQYPYDPIAWLHFDVALLMSQKLSVAIAFLEKMTERNMIVNRNKLLEILSYMRSDNSLDVWKQSVVDDVNLEQWHMSWLRNSCKLKALRGT